MSVVILLICFLIAGTLLFSVNAQALLIFSRVKLQDAFKEINKQFLNRNCTTDCLSFDLSDDDTNAPKSFELVVNAEMAVKEAKSRDHSSEAELALYITHGLLHNLGFDDSSKDRLRKMRDTEDEILKQQGYGLVYSS